MRQHLPDDELRARLARLDPIGDRPVEPAGGPRAAEQMERAMQTLEPPPSLDDRRRSPRRLSPRRVALAGGAVTAAVAGGVYLAVDDPAPPVAEAPTTLELALSEQAATASCIQFDEQILADMPVAFAGTVESVTDDEVLLDVDRWFTDGDAGRVQLDVPGGISPEAAALWYGVDFREGGRYLVTATDGNVNSCGYTAAATPEMEAAFERAFAGS
jgi:hypothetical protein